MSFNTIGSFSWVDLTAKNGHSVFSEIHNPVQAYPPQDQVEGVSLQFDGVILVWRRKADASQDERPVSRLSGHGGEVTQLLSNPEGTILFSSSADRTIKVWDPWLGSDKRACVQTLAGHGGTVTGIQSTENFLFSSSTDCSVIIWAKESGREFLLYPWFVKSQKLDMIGCWVNAIAFSPNSMNGLGTLFAGDARGRVFSFKPHAAGGGKIEWIENEKPRKVMEHGIAQLRAVSQENLLICLGYDYTMRTFDTQTIDEIMCLENPARCRFLHCGFNSERQEVVLIDDKGVLTIFNLVLEQVVKRMELFSEVVVIGDVSFVEGQDEILVAREDAVEAYLCVRNLQYQDFQGHTGPIVAINIWSRTPSSEEKVLSASLDNTVRVWDASDMVCRQVLKEPEGEITCMLAVVGQNAVVAGNEDGRLRVWDLDTGKSTSKTFHSNSITALTAGEHNSRLSVFSTGYDGKVGVWNVLCEGKEVDLELLMMEAIDNAEVLALCFSHDEVSDVSKDNELASRGSVDLVKERSRVSRIHGGMSASKGTLFCGGNSNVVTMLDPQVLEPVALLRGHTDAVTCLCIDGYFLFSGSDDSTVRMWNTHTRSPLKTFQSHTKALRSISVAPDEGYLISCSYDGAVIVWDYTKEEVVNTHRYREEVRCVTFQEKRKRIFAGTEEKNLVVFPLGCKENVSPEGPGRIGPSSVEEDPTTLQLGMLGLTVDEDLRKALEEHELAEV